MKIWISLHFLLLCFVSQANQCEQLAGWLKQSDSLLKTKEGWREKSDLIKKIRQNEYNTAWHIFDRYQKGLLSPAFFTECLDDPSLEQLKAKISGEFKKRSLETLSQSKSEKINKLASNIQDSNKLFIFQAEFESSKTPRKAGYHRMSGAMYYVLPDIPANEFKLHLVHELLHKYDEDILYRTSIDFSDKETNLYLYSLSQDYQSFAQLQPQDKKLVRTYILNGLRRGFLAEFKVWSASYRLYQEMRSHQEIEELAWVENILNQKLSGQNYLDFIFNYYKERFERPARESLFYHDLFQDAYDVVLDEISLIQNKCELMDDLSVFIDECSS